MRLDTNVNNTKRIMAVGKVVPDIGPIIVTEEDVLGAIAWPSFLAGINAAIRGADLSEMQTADEVAGYWYGKKCNGAKPLTDAEIDAELEDYADYRADVDFWRHGC